MKKPELKQDESGLWYLEGDIEYVKGNVYGDVEGDVGGDVLGHVWGDVEGSVVGAVSGQINGRKWTYVEENNNE